MRIELEVAGPVELIDMMEMGCSLGPIDVWVERIERTALSAKTQCRAVRYFLRAYYLLNVANAK